MAPSWTHTWLTWLVSPRAGPSAPFGSKVRSVGGTLSFSVRRSFQAFAYRRLQPRVNASAARSYSSTASNPVEDR